MPSEIEFPGIAVTWRIDVFSFKRSLKSSPPFSVNPVHSNSKLRRAVLTRRPFDRIAIPSSPRWQKSMDKFLRVVFLANAWLSRAQPSFVMFLFPFRFREVKVVLVSSSCEISQIPVSVMLVSAKPSSVSLHAPGVSLDDSVFKGLLELSGFKSRVSDGVM